MSFDIDIDVGNRDRLLELITHTPASMDRDGTITKHNTGIYVNPIPADPLTGFCNIDYQQAEELGYVKIDLLNNSIYNLIRDNDHLDKLLATEPDWDMLKDKTFVEKVVHINNHYNLLQLMPEPVNSIPRMAMFISIIRPAKRHLAGLTWKQVAQTLYSTKINQNGLNQLGRQFCLTKQYFLYCGNYSLTIQTY